MRISEILYELFDVKAPVRQVSQSHYVFAVDGKQFLVAFDAASTPGSVECSLARQGDVGLDKTPFDPLNDMGSRAIVVYSTFVAVCSKYLKVYKPAVMFWYGFTPEQQRLYDKLSLYLARQTPEYRIAKNGVTIGFVRNDIRESDEVLSRDEMRRIEHDKMSRRKPDVSKMWAVAMPGVPTHSPTPAP